MAIVNPNIALAGTPMQVPNVLGMQQTVANTRNTLASTDIMQEEASRASESAEYNTALSRSKDALRFVNTPEQYMAWTDASFSDPVLGSELSRLGLTPDSVKSSALKQFQQPGGFQNVMQMSAANIDQLAGIMGGRASAMAKQQQTAAANARQAAQAAQVSAVMGAGAPSAAPSAAFSSAPVATATPVAPPIDTMQYAPGTPGAINQLYSGVDQAQTPALNALVQPPVGQAPVAQAPVAQAPVGRPPAAGADPRMTQLLELDRLAVAGNDIAAEQAKTLRAQIKFEQDTRPDEPKKPIKVQEYEYAVSQGYPGSFVDFQEETTPSNFQDKFTETLGAARAKANIETVEKAESAVQSLPKIFATLDLIESGDTITGIGAELLTGLERLRSQFMNDVKAGKRVSNTQTLNAYLGSDVFPLIEALGIGARGLDTPAEREFLREVMTGTVNLDRNTLVNLTNYRRDAALNAIKRYNTQIDDGKLNDYFEVIGQTPSRFDVPQRKGASNGDLPNVQTDADYAAVPPGGQYRAPDGSIRRKSQ